MKNMKGITLIALIITIIVMLILVGVTITVAIQGGLFDQARGASSDMQMEADKEMLTSAVIGAVNQNGYVDFSILDDNLPNGFTKVGDRTYKSEKGNEFTVDSETGEVEERNNSTGGIVPQTSGVTGTYNIYFEKSGYPTSIVLNDDLTGKMIMGNNEMSGTYEYNEENNTISFTVNSQTMQLNYEIIGNTKIISMDKSHGVLYTSSNIDGITPLAGKTYYGESTDTDSQQIHSYEYRFKSNGLVEYLYDNTTDVEYKYAVIDNMVWYKVNGSLISLEINNDFTQITDGVDVLYTLQQ